MADILRGDHINSLPQPFLVRLSGLGGWWWEVHDIGIDVPLIRIDVMGKLEVRCFSDAMEFRDADGNTHDPDDWYCKDAALEGTDDDSPDLSDAALDALYRDLRSGGRPVEVIVLGGVGHDVRCLMAADTIAALRAERDVLKAELASGSFYQEKDIAADEKKRALDPAAIIERAKGGEG
jgi:hypothetical protein